MRRFTERAQKYLTLISFLIMFNHAGYAFADEQVELRRINVVFPQLNPRICATYSLDKRERCDALMLELGYVSWALTLVLHGLDVAPRIERGDLKALKQFITPRRPHMTNSEGIFAFVSRPPIRCGAECISLLRLPNGAVEQMLSDFEEAKNALRCLYTRDRSKDDGPRESYDRATMLDVDRMQRNSFKVCPPVSTGAEEILFNTYRR